MYKRQVEIGAGAQDRVELRLVEVVALGVAVDLTPWKPSSSLPRRSSSADHAGSCGANRDHAVEPVGIALARGLELVVRVARNALGFVDVEQRLHAGAGQSEHRLVDPAFVHRLDAKLADVEQALADEGRALRRGWCRRSPTG
jgi:hypothetical protein